MKKVCMVLSAVLLLTMVLAACGGDTSSSSAPPAASVASQQEAESTPSTPEPATETHKIAFITGTGGLGDKNFNDKGYEGVTRLVDNGIAESTVVEPTEISEYETIFRNLSDTGEYTLIVAMGSDTAEPISIVAEVYPDQKFLCIDGFVGDDYPNVRSVFIDNGDSALLAGAMAALLETNNALPNVQGSGAVGAIGGMDIPPNRKMVAAFTLGAKFVNPDIDVRINNVGSFSDPTTGAEQATAMYESGVSLIYSGAGGSGLGVFEAAQNMDRYVFGATSNQNSYAPNNMVASATRSIDMVVEQVFMSCLDGTFENGDNLVNLGVDLEAIKLDYEGSNVEVPEEYKAEIENIKKFIAEFEKNNTLPQDPTEVDAALAILGTYEG